MSADRFPTEFDADEITHLDDTPALPETDDRTPEVDLVCRECGDSIYRVLEDWQPPENADAAWEGWKAACVMVGKMRVPWTFCCRTGAAWVGEIRHDFERRKKPPLDPYEGDRRRRLP